MGKGDNAGLMKGINYFSILCGLVTIGAGAIACVRTDTQTRTHARRRYGLRLGGQGPQAVAATHLE